MTNTTATVHQDRTIGAGARRRTRAAAVAATVVANCLLWVIGAALGADYVITDSQGTAVVSLDVVAIFTAGFALLGWGTLAALERMTRRARAIWTGLALGVFALSLVPVYLVEATTVTALFLALIHAVLPAILVPVLRKGRDRTATPVALAPVHA